MNLQFDQKPSIPYDMAEGAGAQAPPTFKLVLVGDGGTGKVCTSRHTLSHEIQTAVLFSSKCED